MITIEESGMAFGPFQEENVFYVEKSELYKKLGSKVKIGEFILKRGNKLLFVEAKSTAPNPNSDTGEDFYEYIDDISKKLRNSLELFLSANHEIQIDKNQEAVKLIEFDKFNKMALQFILVIRKHDKEWLQPVRDALDSYLIAQRKIWNIKIVVLNPELAKKYKLIS